VELLQEDSWKRRMKDAEGESAKKRCATRAETGSRGKKSQSQILLRRVKVVTRVKSSEKTWTVGGKREPSTSVLVTGDCCTQYHIIENEEDSLSSRVERIDREDLEGKGDIAQTRA